MGVPAGAGDQVDTRSAANDNFQQATNDNTAQEAISRERQHSRAMQHPRNRAASYAPRSARSAPKTGPEVMGQQVPASEMPKDQGRGGQHWSDESITNEFNTVAADNGHTPSATTTTGTDGAGGDARRRRQGR